MNSDRKEKRKEHRETLLMSGWLHQMSSVWGMHRYAALVEAACFSGWYLLKEKEHLLAIGLLFVGSILLHMMILTIRRQSQLLDNFSKDLVNSGALKSPKNSIGFFGGKAMPLGAHQLARLFLAFLIFINSVLILATIPLANLKCTFDFSTVLAIIHAIYFSLLCIRGKVILLEITEPLNLEADQCQ